MDHYFDELADLAKQIAESKEGDVAAGIGRSMFTKLALPTPTTLVSGGRQPTLKAKIFYIMVALLILQMTNVRYPSQMTKLAIQTTLTGLLYTMTSSASSAIVPTRIRNSAAGSLVQMSVNIGMNIALNQIMTQSDEEEQDVEQDWKDRILTRCRGFSRIKTL